MKKSSIALALAAFAASPLAMAVEYSVWGEVYTELTDSDANEDLQLDVTTADFGLVITETFGAVTATGHIDMSMGEYDVAGITVEGAFGSVYVGDNGTGVLAADLTDVLENNSEVFYTDDSAEVIDWGLPVGDAFSVNLFLGINEDTTEDLDYAGVYGSYSMAGATLAAGYTTSEVEAYDSVVDLGLSYETGPVYLALGFQDVDTADDPVFSLAASYTAGAVSITPYYEQFGDLDVMALNLTYAFTDNFYTFFETATYADGAGDDNSEIGMVINF